MRHFRSISASLRLFGGVPILAMAASLAFGQTSDVLKQHNDLANTGQNLLETMLSPAQMKSDGFGLLGGAPVDPTVRPNIPHMLSGVEIYAQPLYVAGLSITGKGRHNVLFVATEHDSVVALDAESTEPLWTRTDFIDGTTRTTRKGNGDLQPEVGITGTPVIDRNTGTLYVSVMTVEGDASVPTNHHQRLHALDIATGADKFGPGFPVEINPTSPGTEGVAGQNQVTFRADLQNQRPGLVLDRGRVYIAWASYQDQGPYHGWMVGYNTRTGVQEVVFNDSESIRRYGAGIWQSGGSPSIDEAGNLFLTTGNGDFDPPAGDWGQTFLRLNRTDLTVGDYFSPYNHNRLDESDADLGTSGLLLLPDAVGSAYHRHLMLSGGKVGIMYLLDRDNLGKFDTKKNNVVQEWEVPRDGDGNSNKFGNGLYSVPAYFNGAVYYVRTGEYIKRVPIADGRIDESTMTANNSVRFGFPGATPSISANGATNGIVWATESYSPDGKNMGDHADPRRMRLHAYDAITLAELFSSGDTAPTIDGVIYNNFVKFVPPTVTNGHVYVASGGKILYFGLKTPVIPVDVTTLVRVTTGRQKVDAATGQVTQRFTLTNTGNVPLAGPVSLVFDDLTADFSLPLTSGTGTTSYTAPTGTFYRNLPDLGPHQTQSVDVTFAPSAKASGNPPLAYRVRVLGGGDVR